MGLMGHIIFITITVIITIIINLSHQDPASWLLIKWSLLYYFVLRLVPFVICVCIASFSRTSSTGMFRGFAKSFPSLLVSNYTSYFFPFNSSFLQIFFIPSSQACRGLPLCLYPVFWLARPLWFICHVPFLQRAQTISYLLILSFLWW